MIDARRGAMVLMTALLVAGCSSAGGGVATGPQTVDGSGVGGHVHQLALDGDELLLGTHDGLWRQAVGQTPRRVSEPAFDVMGLARTGDRLLASGHPGPQMEAPADLGLLASTDGGASWESVALWGEVDFHRLTAAGDAVAGIAAADGALLRSDDAGATWDVLGGVPAIDVALDPGATASMLATTEDGVIASADSGRTWTAVPGSPTVGLLAWTAGTVYGADAEGAIHASTDGGREWSKRGTLPGAPAALAADGDRVVAYVSGAVLESTDGGASFTARVTDLPE